MDKILVVDDVEGNRDLLADILSEEYDVETASNGREAISKLESGENYSLVMLDLIMPEVDGFGVLDYMRDNGLSLLFPVIIISGDSDVETESRCFDYSISDFIAKPFREKVILKRVGNVISLHNYQRLLENALEKQSAEMEKQQNKSLLEQLEALKNLNS